MGYNTQLLMIFKNEHADRIPAVVRAVSNEGKDLKVKRCVQATIGNLTVVSVTGDIISNIVDGIMVFTGSDIAPGTVPSIGKTAIDLEVEQLLTLMCIKLPDLKFNRYREKHWYAEFDSILLEEINNWVISNQPENLTNDVRFIVYVGNYTMSEIDRRAREHNHLIIGNDFHLQTCIVDCCNGGSKIQVIASAGTEGNPMLSALGLTGTDKETSHIIEDNKLLRKIISLSYIWENL